MSRVAIQRNTARSDAELLAKIAEGDLGCLGLLFDRYELDVLRFVTRLGVGAGEVDDLVQATFLVVMRAASNFNGEGVARSWLFGLAANLVRRHRRSFARMTARITAWALERPAQSATSPSEALDASETAARAEKGIALLSPKNREVFVLVALEGACAEDAAAALGIPVATVWTRLHRARRDLRRYLLDGAAATRRDQEEGERS